MLSDDALVTILGLLLLGMFVAYGHIATRIERDVLRWRKVAAQLTEHLEDEGATVTVDAATGTVRVVWDEETPAD